MRSFCAARGIRDGATTLAGIKDEIESRHGALQPIEIETGEAT